MKRRLRFSLLLLPLLLCGMSVAAQEPAKPAGDAQVEPSAIHALQLMADKLRTLKTFEVSADVVQQEVLDDGQRIDFSGNVSYTVQAPNHLYAVVDTDRKHRSFYYDGSNLTVYAPRMNFYAQKPFKGTIAQLVDAARDKYGIELPLGDLFYWGTDRAPMSLIDSATVIGPSHVGDTECDHLAFRQKGVDWQLWISRETLLPRKLVIVDLSDPSLPQYSAVLDWKTSITPAETTFHFTPGKDDHRIEIGASNVSDQSTEASP